LHALVAEAEGKKLVIATLYKLVGRITDYYHSHGYPLARAVIPAQTISNGVVHVQVYEAEYGKIELNNSSRVKSLLLAKTLSSLQPGDVIAQAKLDRALLLLSDIPGVVVNSTLKPGEAVGTSDLQVTTSPSKRVYGNVVLDNYGNGYTGRPRIGGTVNVIDPLGLGLGDTLSLSGLSAGDGLNYGRVAYESMLNQYGTRMGGSFSALHYK
jgi:hemolysin activation/secretion protein